MVSMGADLAEDASPAPAQRRRNLTNFVDQDNPLVISRTDTKARGVDIVNIAEAKAKLSALVDRAAAGEDIILARAGKPLVRLTALANRLPGSPAWHGTGSSTMSRC